MKQFHDYVKDHAERTPDKIALTISGREITYGALDELACVVARQLVGTGMATSDRVALHAPTSIETIACALGVMKAGFVLVLMHYGIAAEKLIHREVSKVDAVSRTRPILLERLAESAAQLSCARHLYHAIALLLHDAGVAGRSLSVQELLTLKRDRAYLVRLCVQAVQRLVQQMGTAVIFEASPVQRHWRDLQVMASHLDVNWDTAMLAYGDFAMDHHPCDPAMKG